MTAICATKPADWWETDSDGARLALMLCSVCPARRRCATLDPAPHGVIHAGVAYSDDGTALPPCPSCGYPQLGRRVDRPDVCQRCRVPGLSQWRSDIQRWHAQGVPDRIAARRLATNPEAIRNARRSRVGRTSKSAPPAADADPGPIDELVVEQVLAGATLELTDGELVTLFRAAKARKIPLSRLSNRLGVNYRAAQTMAAGLLPAHMAARARRARAAS